MPVKRPIFRYTLLAFLFVITAAFEAPYFYDTLRNETRDSPYFAMQDASNRVKSASLEAVRAGVREGDEIISIDGHPYDGLGQSGQALYGTPVGGAITLVLRSADSSHPGDRTVVLQVHAKSVDVFSIVEDFTLYLFLPGVCILLGFWVAAQRPHDPMAWLLLALMLAFPHVLDSGAVVAWAPGWRELATFYQSLGTMLPFLMFLFGRFFPEPFPAGGVLDKVWRKVQWFVALPYIFFDLVLIIEWVIELSNYRLAAPLERVTRWHNIRGFSGFLLTGSFFAAMAIKYRISRSADTRRRLRILFWGATTAWTPVVLALLYSQFAGRPLNELFSQWVIYLIVLPLVLFPLTLAYVIVVQKAMNVGVALRQGLQYALAKGGIRVLQVVVVSAVGTAVFMMASNATRNRPQKISVIAIGITATFSIRRLGDRLRTGIDRRFFREAYDAEQVLSELGEQVRTMVEPGSLLETVATRISQTLHVPQVAVLLGGGERYHPAFALGYAAVPDVSFSHQAGTTRALQQHNEPAQVFLKDRESWLYREEDMNDEERTKLAKLGSELLLPLATRGTLLGFISLGPKRSEEPYTSSDVRLLKSVATQTGLALENANLVREVADAVAQRELLNRELEIAREVQERLFPQKLPAIAGLDYAGHCRPALGVGGDYYDFLALPQGHLGVAIGDVSGKGIAAALMMASLQASLRGEATRAPDNLATAVGNINRLVYEASSVNRYATFFYGQYDPESRKFHYVNAGHNPPMLLHCSDGRRTMTRLEIGGTVVGLLENFAYEQGCISLAAGDLLVAYTDGISEAMNAAEEEWGEERMMETIERSNGSRAQELLENIFNAADAFVAGAKQHDDMTLVILRVLERVP